MSVRVRIDDIMLESNGASWSVHEVRVRTKGKHVGEEYAFQKRSYGDLAHALQGVIDRSAAASGATSLEELRDAHNRICALLVRTFDLTAVTLG